MRTEPGWLHFPGMLPCPAPTSFLSRQSRLRPVGLKSASGGHRRYTAPKLFEMPSGTREYAPFPTKPRWSVVLAQTTSTNAPAPKPKPGVIPPGGVAPSLPPGTTPPTPVPAPAKPETPASDDKGHVAVGAGGTWVSPLLVGGGGRLTVDDKGHVWFTGVVAFGTPGVSGSVDVGTPPASGSSGSLDIRGGGGVRPNHLGGGRVPTVGGSGDTGGAQMGVGLGTPGVQVNYSYTWQIR